MPVYIDALELENKTVPVIRVQYADEETAGRAGIYLTVGRADIILKNIDAIQEFVNKYGYKENGCTNSKESS